MKNTIQRGEEGELAVKAWLEENGIRVHRSNRRAPFDLYNDAGTRIEVKTSSLRREPRGWAFTLKPSPYSRRMIVDVYVFRCLWSPASRINRTACYDPPIHLVIPSPIRYRGMNVLLTDLDVRWRHAVGNLSVIRRMDMAPRLPFAQVVAQANPKSGVAAEQIRRICSRRKSNNGGIAMATPETTGLVYIAHNSGVFCVECGGYSDAVLKCPCGSSALVNLASILDRVLLPDHQPRCDA